MTLFQFISKLNWRLIVAHFIACWFIYHRITQLAYLYDYNFLEFAGHHKYEETLKVYRDGNQPFGVRISMDLFYAGLAGIVAVLISSVVSLLVSLKNKWFWLNSLIVLLVVGLVSWFIDRFYWTHVKRFFMFPGLPFKSDWWFNFMGGIFMLVIGVCLFSLKKVNDFIGGRKRIPFIVTE